MSLDKAIEHHKEKRQPYRGSKAIDGTCRNHGSCDWCRQNRQHKFRDKEGENMRIETTYYAFDETEFDNREECLAYEEACTDSVNNAVAFFDKDLKRMTTETDDIQTIAENAMFMKIMDGEKATHLLKWLYGYTGCCITEGLPETLKAGELYAWNNADYVWYNQVAQLEELRKTVDAIEKAVNAS